MVTGSDKVVIHSPLAAMGQERRRTCGDVDGGCAALGVAEGLVVGKTVQHGLLFRHKEGVERASHAVHVLVEPHRVVGVAVHANEDMWIHGACELDFGMEGRQVESVGVNNGSSAAQGQVPRPDRVFTGEWYEWYSFATWVAVETTHKESRRCRDVDFDPTRFVAKRGVLVRDCAFPRSGVERFGEHVVTD